MIESKQSVPQFPSVKWAQRKDVVYLTVELADAQNVKIDLTDAGVLSFSATSHGTAYEFTMQFFDAIVKEKSKWNINGRYPIFMLAKANQQADYWPRLIKNKVKNNRITVDWSKWVEEDEEAETIDM